MSDSPLDVVGLNLIRHIRNAILVVAFGFLNALHGFQ
jgi:hypothetical protein